MNNSIKTYKAEAGCDIIKPILDTLPFAISWGGENEQALGCNVANENIFGMDSKEIVGKTAYDFGTIFGWDKCAIDAMYCNISKTLLYNKAHVISTNLTLTDKNTHSYIAFCVPIATDTRVKYLCIGTNIEIFFGANSSIADIFLSTKNISDAIEICGKLAFKNKSLLNFDSTSNNSNKEKITARELDCIKLLKIGLSSKEISFILKISKRTVETYIENARYKFNAKNSVELVAKCIERGLCGK